MRTQKALCLLTFVFVVLCSFCPSAAADGEWKKGLSLYKSYQFQKAIDWFSKTIATPPASWKNPEKARAYIMLSVSYFNLANIDRAKATYEKALALHRKVALPKGLPQNVKERYKGFYDDWVKRNPPPRSRPIKRRVVKRRTPPRRVVKRRIPPRRRKLAVRRRMPPRPRPTPKAQPFKHTTSLILLAVGVAALGGAIGLGVLSTDLAKKIQQVDPNDPDAANKTEAAYNNAFGPGLGSTILWIAGGGLLAAGIGVLIFELATKYPKKTAALPTTRSPAMAQQPDFQLRMR